MICWIQTNEGFTTHLKPYTTVTNVTNVAPSTFSMCDFESCLEKGFDVYVGY